MSRFAVCRTRSRATRRKKRWSRSSRNYLAKLEQFTAPTATVEMSKGVLNAETVQKLTMFQF